jgi:hypothetical protein
VDSDDLCRHCGGYVGHGAFCTRCGEQRGGGALLSVGATRSAAERLGVSMKPPPVFAAPAKVAMPTFADESVSAWSSQSFEAPAPAKKGFGFFKLVFAIVCVIGLGKGAMVGYQYAMNSIKPSSLSAGDCIAFDEQGLNPHVSSCQETYYGTVVAQVTTQAQCGQYTATVPITHKDEIYCIAKKP